MDSYLRACGKDEPDTSPGSSNNGTDNVALGIASTRGHFLRLRECFSVPGTTGDISFHCSYDAEQPKREADHLDLTLPNIKVGKEWSYTSKLYYHKPSRCRVLARGLA
jgi:hypothetical protein